ncbi:sodium:calcium antiporter [Maritimibacter sp. 55A14]|uniref:calcium/sodium antiporter n=1 Tax=Maritimibacter sp. 55A14 TaxID=2174844 RepID=UPI000D606A94|nr:calcium/sodium antiporter [Maritimibacter sp. 55A14]PWE33357.1 sodium:calcium antiporter [Maritimibacter sp. 55A14]
MQNVLPYLMLAGGFAALLAGGEYLVRGAVNTARRLDIPPMVIGLTLVGFGTSMPELATSLQAALAGSPGIALGNVVGSNIANILLILGLAAVLMPIAVAAESFRRDAAVLIAATALCILAALSGTLDRWHGVVFLVGLGGFLWLAFRKSAPAAADVYTHEAEFLTARSPLWLSLVQFAGGLAVVLLGARFLVSGAIEIATRQGISEATIGLTVVAVGTSLPELVTSAIAVRRGQSDVAFGNIIGSNIFNILGILGCTVLVAPLPVPPDMLRFDLWVMLAATLLMTVFALTGRRISRGEGTILLALYVAYLGFLAT